MNSNNQSSNPETSPITSTPSAPALSPSEEIQFNEAPLLSLPPGQSILAPSKPLVEMSDEELRNWHAMLREHKNFMTMQAHLVSVGTSVTKPSKQSKPKQDISEFV